jgi:hypothetical protein
MLLCTLRTAELRLVVVWSMVSILRSSWLVSSTLSEEAEHRKCNQQCGDDIVGVQNLQEHTPSNHTPANIYRWKA